MKISIIGYNLFNPGGTTRSNTNLIHEFLDVNYEVAYYNYTEFSPSDVINLRYNDDKMKGVEFYPLSKLIKEEVEPSHYYYITKETFFPLAKILRSKFPSAQIIGEIHAPLDLIHVDLTDYLEYFSYVRVATESIKANFMEKYNFDRVFVQKVSVKHIDTSINCANINPNPTKNLLIFSRFDEESKDIAYAIRLMDYVVNYLKETDIQLYINGYGQGEVLYKNLINYYNLSKNVHINKPMPDDYIYLSTSRYETFGYSIVESLSKGHSCLIYQGNDYVLRENFEMLQSVEWLEKDIQTDGEILVNLTNKILKPDSLEHDISILNEWKKAYVNKMIFYTREAITFNKRQTKRLNSFEIQYLFEEINSKTSNDDLSKFRLVYHTLKNIPLVGTVLNQELIKTHGKSIIENIFVRNNNAESDIPLNSNYYFIESFHGKNFSGDPKYLALAIKEQFPDSVFYVSSVNQLVDMEIRSYGFIPVRTGSPRYVEAFSECKYIIVNGNTIDAAGKRKKQIVIQTWHGLPLKKMVNDLENLEERQAQSNAFAPRMNKWNYLITSGSYNTSLLSSAFRLKDNSKLRILEAGAPRNSYLIKNRNSDYSEKARLSLKYFNRPYDSEKVFVLFCPTWRKDKRNQISSLDLKEIITQLPDHYEMIVKLHPLEGHLRKHFSNIDPRIHCFFNEIVDIQELYILSDVLISDYSSAMFDYAHLNRKIIVLQEDSEEYHSEVGWYFDIKNDYKLIGQNYTTESIVQEIVSEPNIESNQLITQKLLPNDSKYSPDKIINAILKRKG